MRFAHQEPTDLVLGIVCWDNSSFSLTVLDQASLELGDWRFVFEIVGESHRVRIERGGQPVMQEVLACVDIPSTIRHHHRFASLAAHQFKQAGYTINVRFAMGPPALLQSPGLEVRFPGNGEPITQVQWSHDGDILRWWTLHAYPGRSQTVNVLSTSEFCRSEYVTGA